MNSRAIQHKIRRLFQVEEALKQGERRPVTVLTSLKSLCKDPELARRFVTHLVQRTLEQDKSKRSRRHQDLMGRALKLLEKWPGKPQPEDTREARECWQALRNAQSDTKWIRGHQVRLISDNSMLLLEQAVELVLHPEQAGNSAYDVARDYARGFDPHLGSGLIPDSAPKVRDIAEFFQAVFPAATNEQARGNKATPLSAEPKFTRVQGQYLAYIHTYHRLHKRGPAEADLVSFFGVTPPTAHSMVVRLDEQGLITREPGVARSMRVAIPEEDIPDLD